MSGKLRLAGVKEVLLLQSTPLVRKYASFIDAAWTSLFHRCVCVVLCVSVWNVVFFAF